MRSERKLRSQEGRRYQQGSVPRKEGDISRAWPNLVRLCHFSPSELTWRLLVGSCTVSTNSNMYANLMSYASLFEYSKLEPIPHLVVTLQMRETMMMIASPSALDVPCYSQQSLWYTFSVGLSMFHGCGTKMPYLGYYIEKSVSA